MNGRLFIGGTWTIGQGADLESRDPFDKDLVWHGSVASDENVRDAVSAARDALPQWAGLAMAERESFLTRYAQELSRHQEVLAEAISREVGKPLWESRGEVGTMVNKIAVSIAAARERCPHRESATPDGARSVTRFKPHGVVAVLGPFNFPGHLPNGHIVPALLAGNTVVFKPSEKAPRVGEIMAERFEASGFPAGVINLIQGDRTTATSLLGQPGLDGVYFTGSAAAGLAIHRQFAGRPDKILALEMGGNNPLVVLDVADLMAATYGTIQSAYLTSGQRCVCARRLVLVESKTDRNLVSQLTDALSRVRIGHFRDSPEPFMGPVISRQAASQILDQQQTLLDHGAQPLKRVERSPRSLALLAPGLLDVSSVADRPDEEIFGPLLQLVRVANFEAAIEEANRTAFGLAAAIFCQRREDFEYFYRRSRAGIVNWNRPTTGASSSAPFGGVGLSGNHRPSAYFAADYCAYPVASMEADQLSLPHPPPPGLDV